MWKIEGKVALVTGGASGLGLLTIEELLQKGLKGVIIADVNPEFGKKAVERIGQKFGPGKVIFKQTDVTNKSSVEDAFKAAIENFKQLDIVINNAGIMNDSIWEKEVDINIKGLVYGTLLAHEEYLPKYKSGEEGVIVNLSSVLGVDPFIVMPVYCGTKSFVVNFSRSIAEKENYDRTKVRILVICPGATDTPLLELTGKTLGPSYEKILSEIHPVPQSPEYLTKELVSVIEKGTTGSCWVVEDGSATEIHFKDRFELQKS